VGGGIISRPQVANEQSQRCAVIPEAEGEKGNMCIKGTTRFLFVSLLKSFSSKTQSIFALESIFQLGWYVTSSEGNPVSEADFRALERNHIFDHKKYNLTNYKRFLFVK
jgi:hypothetical protein